MNPSSRSGANPPSLANVICEDGGRILCREWRSDGSGGSVLLAMSAAEHPPPAVLDRLTHEYALKDELDAAWAVRPLDLVRDRGRTILMLHDPGGEPLEMSTAMPMEVERVVAHAIGVATALGGLHQRGLVHKDVKPANILVNCTDKRVRLTGFGLASRLPRERRAPDPPEAIAGTLAYMAPEQTGRMNRSIDSRSDLYALGVTLYQMLTGALPFTASDPMEWVHCHVARQPMPPGERRADIPATLSAIVLKLLAKAAEDRYQTAAGVEADLRRCLAEWKSRQRIEAFPLGAHDIPDRLLIPEKLYGRATEIDRLLAAFDRVVIQGKPELVLVSGYSGIGKSSVVNELHKVLVPPRGLFAAGKHDQYKRDIPYATLAQALRALVHQILVKSEDEVERWRRVLAQAVEPNGHLVIGIVPELEFVIGKQPPVPELPAPDARARFQLVFRRLLGAFARPEHPLALFLDDLQWLDAATLDLIEHLITHPDTRHLLLVGAYRNNDVSPSHPLARRLEAMRKAGARVQEIVLAPLGRADIGQLVADALHEQPDHVRPLAQLVQEKTGGNPFFVIQFLTALADEGMLAFDQVARAWRWQMERMRAKNYTDNVVDLMAGKLKRLSAAGQEALMQLACLGNFAPAAALVAIQGASEAAVHATLWEAVRAGLIYREDQGYKFLHDRIQQAAYTLIPQEFRADLHLRIGRALRATMSADQLAEHLFDVVNQMNRGAARLRDTEERAQLAALNLYVGRKAKASAAFASAAVYLRAGMSLLDRDVLDRSDHYELAFSLSLERAECELLGGDFDEAERLLSELIGKGKSRIDKAAAYRLKLHLHIVKSEKPQGVAAALECLRLFGIEMSPHPTHEQVKAEYDAVWKNLQDRSIESLADLPVMTDAEVQAATRVLAFLTGPSLYTDNNLYYWHFCKMVNLALRHGINDASAFGFAGFGVILCLPFRRYADGHRFAKLACDLVEKHGFSGYKARVYVEMEMVSLWSRPVEIGIELTRAALRAGAELGDLAFACYSCMHLVTDLLVQGAHLADVWRESEACLDFVRKSKYFDAADIIVNQQQLIRLLRGQTASLSTFNDETFDEAAFEARLTDDRMTPLISRYWILKIQARFISGDYREALAAVDPARQWHWSSEAFLHSLDYFYYAALTVAACHEGASSDERRSFRALIAAYLAQLREWAENYPPTFADKHALVAAEIARLDGQDADAMRLYEQAIRAAHDNGFVQNEGISYEVAARFYAARGFESIADAFLRKARSCYLQWGADGKVRQLDRLFPQLAADERYRATVAVGPAARELDVATVVKASQALSSEIVLPKLIERLLTIALENAGADRALLILPSESDHLIQAEAHAVGDQLEVVLGEKPIGGAACPDSLVRYVIRTNERVLLDDASRPNLFSEDDYLRGRRVKSILCLPLIKQTRLTGLLYLENALTAYAFSPDRVAVLELLASQAAIALVNSRLYRDLEEREARFRRLFDASVIGIAVWRFDGRIVEANDAYLQIVGYDRDDLVGGRVTWTALTPEEWRDHTTRAIAEMRATGKLPPYEKEYIRKDGSRVPVLLGGATISAEAGQAITFVLDLTARRRAEAEARESEQRYRQVQMELSHANRLATMGQLTASIAHEVNQPITGVVASGNAAMRWLGNQPPDLAAARQAIERVIRDGTRAGAVVGRIGKLVKKAPTRTDTFDINAAIREVVELTGGEAFKNGISVRTELMDDLLFVDGDRVELQQVILNLSINAIEAMAGLGDGPLELLIETAREPSDAVLVSVHDSGRGIDPLDVERAFEAFYTTKPGGMGMGLSICRSIVEANGGRIWTTRNVPRGASFHFNLPTGVPGTS
jgi:PAS domain S-box-containing protein